MRPPFDIVGSFGSLEELYELMEGPARPAFPHGGAVRLNPRILPEQDISTLLGARLRLEQLGLHLVVTPAVGMPCIELWRHTPSALREPA